MLCGRKVEREGEFHSINLINSLEKWDKLHKATNQKQSVD